MALPPSRSTCAPTSEAALCWVAMTPLVMCELSIDISKPVPARAGPSRPARPREPARAALGPPELSRGDELDRARLYLEQRRQESHVLAVEVDAHLFR